MSPSSSGCDGLIGALRGARKRLEILTALQDATNIMSSPETPAYSKYLILIELVSMFVPSTVGLLTAKEFKDIFTRLFHLAPVDDAFIAFICALNSQQNSQIFRLQHIIILLDDLEKTRLQTLLIESFGKDPNDVAWNVKFGELCNLLGKTTYLVHNALGSAHSPYVAKPFEAVLQGYLNNHWIHVFKAIKIALEDAVGKCQDVDDLNLNFIAGLVFELCRGDSAIFRTLIGWLELHVKDAAIWSCISSKLLTDNSNGVEQSERLILLTLLAARNGEMLQKLFGKQIYENRTVKRVFFEKALFVKVFPLHERIPEKIAMCLHHGSKKTNEQGAYNQLHTESVLVALDVWSSSVHVKHSSDEQQAYIDSVLLNFVKYANEEIRRAVSSKAVTAIAYGVDSRLRCSNYRRSFRGLYVGEVLAKWFSLGNLNFKCQSKDDEFLTDLKKIAEADANKPDKTIELDKPNRANEVNTANPEASINTELDKELVELKLEDVQQDTGEIDSDDDDFPDYEIPEEERFLKKKESDENYRHVDTPYYIRDCIDGLNETDDYAKFEAAFNALEPMIRRRSVGYDQSAEELIRRLVNLTNRFNIEQFEEKRLNLLVACLVTSPHLGSVVVEMMFSRSSAMTTRYIILVALTNAASEYSSTSPVIETQSSEAVESGNDKVLINGKLLPRTKRFTTTTNSLKKNNFTPIASSFFYPLTAIDVHREHLDLLGRDSELLARILVCMGHLIKSSDMCPCTIPMASTLSQLLTPLRHHEDLAVRQGVLFCYASICLTLNSEMLLHFHSDEMNDWYQYAAKLAQGDPSSECRQMAQMASETIAGAMYQFLSDQRFQIF